MSEVVKFLREFARDPNHIGAVAPSSSHLAACMVAAVDIRPGHVVVEVGAGTGPFTRRIRQVAPEAHLLALEPNAELAAHLRAELPGVEVVERMAHELPEIVREWGHEKVDRVVSGLPWALWPPEVQDPIFDGILAVLAPEGRMATFTYVHSQVLPPAQRLKDKLHRRFARVERTPVTWRNVPPAFVWVCSAPR